MVNGLEGDNGSTELVEVRVRIRTTIENSQRLPSVSPVSHSCSFSGSDSCCYTENRHCVSVERKLLLCKAERAHHVPRENVHFHETEKDRQTERERERGREKMYIMDMGVDTYSSPILRTSKRPHLVPMSDSWISSGLFTMVAPVALATRLLSVFRRRRKAVMPALSR